LSHQTTWSMDWFNVVGFGIFSIKSLKSLRNPICNWFMNAILSNEMSHASYLNLYAYINVGWSPRWSDHNLFVDMCTLFESPKKIFYYLKNIQNHSIMDINTPTKVQTMLKLCLIARC
jgi:hypothetical protein